jgi:uncharacterized membrane protein YidH (DUF202 family)
MRDLILTFLYIVALGLGMYRLARWCELTQNRRELDDVPTPNTWENAP